MLELQRSCITDGASDDAHSWDAGIVCVCMCPPGFCACAPLVKIETTEKISDGRHAQIEKCDNQPPTDISGPVPRPHGAVARRLWMQFEGRPRRRANTTLMPSRS